MAYGGLRTTMASVAHRGVTCAILADRNAPLADRLRQLLTTVSGTVFSVADPESLLDGARRLKPGLLILDLGFAEHDAMQLLRQIKAEVPQARLIVLSLYDDPLIADATLAEGADGIVLKRSIGDDLLPAVDAVLSGGTFVSPGFQHDRPA